MTKQAYKLVSTAKSDVGYMEKATNAQLDDKTANAGRANYTKYGAWYGMNGFPWCAMFVSYCAEKAGIPTSVIPKHASCSMGVSWFKHTGRWRARAGYKPQPGDIIYFTRNGVSAVHVGVVTAVDTVSVSTVEGNTSNAAELIENGGCVAAKCYKLTSPRILGYGNPAYVADKPIETPKTIRFGSKGVAVAMLQNRLNKRGFPCGKVDGDFGRRTLEAVKAFQAAKGLIVDGVVGPKTWKVLQA